MLPSFLKRLTSPQILACAKLNNLALEVPPDFAFGVTNQTPDYLAKFPLGKIPVLEHGDFCLTESLAIAEYVAKHGPASDQLLGATAGEQAHVHQFTYFNENHFGPTMRKLTVWRFGYGTYDEKVEEAEAKNLERWLEYLEGVLKGRKWFVDMKDGRGPSLADLAIADHLYMGFVKYIDAEMRKDYPALVEWYKRVSSIPEIAELYAGEMVDKRAPPPGAE